MCEYFVSENGRIEPYNLANNNWDAYVRRVKQFITLNNIDDTLKMATLVSVVGAEYYELNIKSSKSG